MALGFEKCGFQQLHAAAPNKGRTIFFLRIVIMVLAVLCCVVDQHVAYLITNRLVQLLKLGITAGV